MQNTLDWEAFINALNKNLVGKAELEAELSARYGKNDNVKVTSGGGRLGLYKPIKKDQSIGLGLSGGGFRAKGDTPYGKVNERDFIVDNLDAKYSKGLNTFRGSMGLHGNPNWDFSYERKF